MSTAQDSTAWAVGSFLRVSMRYVIGTQQTLTLRLDGATWRRVASPGPGRSAYLTGVSPGPGGTTWAVGYYTSGSIASETVRTVILRWDETAWSIVASPSPGRVAMLSGMSVAPGGGARP